MRKTAKKPPGPRPTFLSELAPYTEILLKTGIREQFAALCIRSAGDDREIEILLVTSRESNRWIIPKGWPMKGKKPHEVATIEAFEEAGVRGLAQEKPFGYYTYLKLLDDGQRVPCCVQVHVMEVEEVSEVFREKGQRVRDWVSCLEAARRVREPELKGLLLSLHGVGAKAVRERRPS